MAATMRIPTEFTAIDKFSSVVGKMTSGVTTFSKSATSAAKRVNTKINGMFSSLNSFSQLALGIGAAGLFSMAIKGVTDYETALHSLEAVTGEVSSKFTGQIETLAKKQKKSVVDIAGGFEIVGSAMSQYLDNPDALYKIVDAGITLAKAAKMDVQPALEALTSAMNQFNLGADQAEDVINRLTAGEIVGSVSTAKATEQLSKFGAVANSINVTLPESIALIQTLGKKFTGAMQSEIGTASKNMLLIMDTASSASKEAQKLLKRNGVDMKILGNHSLSLGTRLKELSKIQNDGAAKAAVFGKDNAVAGAVIFDQLDTYLEWEKQIENTNKAHEQAAINSDTLINKLAETTAAFTNYFATNDKANKGLNKVKSALKFVAENMDLVISSIGFLIGGFVVLKTWLMLSAIWTFVSSVAMGIYGAVSDKATIAIGANSVALRAYKTMQVLMTAGTWLATAAMTAFSFVMNLGLWPILAIVAAIAAIIAIFYYWDEIVAWFSKQWDAFVGWISELWGGVVKFFEEFSFVDFFISIGQAIIDYMLFPLKAVLKLVAMIPGGIGEAAQAGLDKLNDMTNISMQLGRDNKQTEAPEVVNSQNQQSNKVSGGVDINIKDKGKNVESAKSQTYGMPVMVTSTTGAGGNW